MVISTAFSYHTFSVIYHSSDFLRKAAFTVYHTSPLQFLLLYRITLDCGKPLYFQITFPTAFSSSDMCPRQGASLRP